MNWFNDATLINVATGQTLSGGKLVFNINNKTYTAKTNASGQAKIALDDLPLGTYEAVISFAGHTKYNPSNTTIEVPIKHNTTIVFVYDDDAKELVATLIDNQTGQGIRGGYIAMKVNGVTTKIKADSKGKAVFSTADLAPGNYTVKLSYSGSVRYYSTKTTSDIIVE